MENITEILKSHWGYDSLRPLQREIIESILEGKDTLAVLPTGGGKSICFQVPAISMDGICLVISPLIALMKDQVENLQKRGIYALSIHSGMSFTEVKKTLQNAAYGNYKFLYVSPERLETALFKEFLPAIKPTLIAVDEAHCISQWGYDFRPTYLRISSIREEIPDAPVIALTASATRKVQNDICEKLLFGKNSVSFRQSFARPNLSYSVFSPEARQDKMLEILHNVPGAGIVYCRSRKHTAQIADLLNRNHIKAGYYHAGLASEQRSDIQNKWIQNELRVIVSTNAFGMGIDKPDVRTVIHYDIPDCIENYYQEAGRAGRDGLKSYAVLLYEEKTQSELEEIINTRYPPYNVLKETYSSLMNYLQVAAGTGEGLSFDFDFAVFSDNFKINTRLAESSLRVFVEEGLIELTASAIKASQLAFTVSREELNEFENRYPECSELAQTLLRNYEGIFHNSSSIRESLLAKQLKTSVAQVKKRLLIMQANGIVSYKSFSDKPQVCLLTNRMYGNAFTLNTQLLNERRKVFKEQLKAMHQYATNHTECRAVMIGRYFNDQQIKECGICDNCINKRKRKIHRSQFSNISNQLTNLLQNEPMNVKELLKQLNTYPEHEIWETINFLIAEKKIIRQHNNMLSLKK